MDDNNLVITISPHTIDELEEVVRDTAIMICAEQPDVPRPESLSDLDSFSLVQVLLELENVLNMRLLEKMEHYEGPSFRELATFIARIAYQDAIDKEEHEASVAAIPEPSTSD
jgi:hypothetical protein